MPFATKTKSRRFWAFVALAFGVLVAVSCGPVDVTMPDGSTQRIPYDAWLATTEGQINLTKVQQAIGTFTPTPTPLPTLTPTTTATLTPIPSITPSPTATPFTGFWVVDNKIGEVVHLAQFQPDCSGEWGYPGIDIWYVQNGQAVQKICGTPWNRPQNVALKVVGYAFAALIGFFVILVAGNEFRKWNQGRKRKQYMNERNQRQLGAPSQVTTTGRDGSRQTSSGDEVGEFIRLLATADGGLARDLVSFRRSHREALRGVHTIESFSAAISKHDKQLFEKVQAILTRARSSR